MRFRSSSKTTSKSPSSSEEEVDDGARRVGDSLSDTNDHHTNPIPTVNLLTTQRLQNWKAFPQPHQPQGQSPPPSGTASAPPPPPSTKHGSVSNLILLIEQGQWSAASHRATTHPHEARQLVKLRKTTTSCSASGANPKSAALISNVKCKALHHACQKLRSVHTSIYQLPSSSCCAPTSAASSTARVVEEDDYIEACKCILTLIQIHPEACKERESRHGCLPLHLGVFSMCATPPPPPLCSKASSSWQGEKDMGDSGDGPKKKSQRSFSDFFNHNHGNYGSSGGGSGPSQNMRPPPIQNRSGSVGGGGSGGQPQQQQQHHTRNSSGDFSVGNISTMIQEESEHQQKLEDHRARTKKGGNKNGGDSGGGGDDDDDDHFESRMMGKLNDMEKLLSVFESSSSLSFSSNDKKKKKKSGGGTATSNSSSSSTNKKKIVGWGPSIISTTTTEQQETTKTMTKVVGAITPLDALEEKSRETDSYSTPMHKNNNDPHSAAGSEAMMHPLMRAPPNPSQLASVRQYGRVSPTSSFDNKSDDGSSTRSGGTSTTANSSQNSSARASSPSSFSGVVTSSSTTMTTTAAAAAAATPPTHEELQRRYLQINTRRRDEFSIRVIDALLDAWPRGSKTASEGGRLPLHMACFGKATVRVMETILRSYPDAARQRNADGFLPIHIAAHWGVSHPDVAPLLLRAYPDGAVGRNRWERTPIEEALGMAGENGREHQMSLVWSLRRHPTYWIHNDITTMLLPRNVRNAPWRIADMGKESRTTTRIGGRNGLSSAVDVDEVGSTDEEEEGIEVQMPSSPMCHNPKQIKALAESTDLSLLIARDKHWEAAALRCRLCPNEAGEALEVKVRGAYTAKITPLLFACEHNPSVELIKALIKANPSALKRRQDPGGQLPIHAACTWGASFGVIDLLLSADPSMAEEQDFLSNLPLHCACYSGAETSIIRALLRVYPQSVWPRNHQGSSAVDIVKRLSHPNRREVLGLLDMTMKSLLEKKKKETKKGEEGVEVEKDNSLMWV